MNQKILKAGILIAILVVPALLFTFLKTFGDNRFNLPYYFPELDESGHVQVLKGDTLFHTVPNFKLLNQNSRLVTLFENADKLKVVSFFFSRCGTICPVLNENLSRIAEMFTEEERLKLISISIDPEFDTPDVLKLYEKQFGDFLNWEMLTGDKEYIYNLAIQGFKLPVSDASVYDPGITNIDDAFIHSDKVLLLDKENKVRGIYDGTSVEELDRLKAEIKVLLNGLSDERKK